MIEIHSEDEFLGFIRNDKGGELVVIDFSATWCPPSKMFEPTFKALARKYPQVIFLRVDTDKQSDGGLWCNKYTKTRYVPEFQVLFLFIFMFVF